MKTLDAELASEAKAIVALAFRNGPIEDVHAGKVCPVCNGSSDYSRITEDEMKAMMKSAVNAVYKLLWNRDHDSEAYRKSIEYGVRLPCSTLRANYRESVASMAHQRGNGGGRRVDRVL